MPAYTDATKIAAFLGVTLTAAQITQAGVVAQAASDWIDSYLHRSWQAASPVTEVHEVAGDFVYLDRRPVAGITSVETRSPAIGAAYSTLGASQYELLDAAAGLLQLQGWGDYLARVTYTHSAATPPSHVALAATMIAAAWLGPTLRPNTQGLESVSVGQNDVALKFSASRTDVPIEALTILGKPVPVIA